MIALKTLHQKPGKGIQDAHVRLHKRHYVHNFLFLLNFFSKAANIFHNYNYFIYHDPPARYWFLRFFSEYFYSGEVPGYLVSGGKCCNAVPALWGGGGEGGGGLLCIFFLPQKTCVKTKSTWWGRGVIILLDHLWGDKQKRPKKENSILPDHTGVVTPCPPPPREIAMHFSFLKKLVSKQNHHDGVGVLSSYLTNNWADKQQQKRRKKDKGIFPDHMRTVTNVGCLSLASEMNGGNIRLRMTEKINVGCLSLASEMNGGNIRLRMTVKINVGCLSLASEMNGGNIRLRMTVKINVGCLSLASEMKDGIIRLRMTHNWICTFPYFNIWNIFIGYTPSNLLHVFQLFCSCTRKNVYSKRP